MFRHALLLLFALSLVAAGDWPVFHGNPEQTGVAAGKLPDKLETLWTFKTDDAFENAVAVAGGVVYAANMDEHLYAIDLTTGKQKWKYKGAPFKGSPAIKCDVVYVGDLDGLLHAVETKTGKKKWTFEANAEIGGVNFHQENILFASHDENLYCLTKDGKERWKFKTDGPIYGSPAVASGKTFLVGCDSQMHVIDVDKGKELGAVNLEGQTGGTAGVLGDVLYVGTMKNEVKAIDWKKGTVVWTYADSKQAFYSSPAVTSKYVVIGSRDKMLHCIDRAKGTGVWTFATGNRVDSSPVIVGSRVVVGSLDKKLYVLDLDKGTKVQEILLDGPVAGSPVVVDGKVIIGTQKGTLYCLGKK